MWVGALGVYVEGHTDVGWCARCIRRGSYRCGLVR